MMEDGITKVELERIRITTIALLDAELLKYDARMHLNQFKVSASVDNSLKKLAVEFCYEVFGKRTEDVYYYPADWKQAFKERWFPKWLCQKFPVKFIKVDIARIYPELRGIPNQQYLNIYTKTRIDSNKIFKNLENE